MSQYDYHIIEVTEGMEGVEIETLPAFMREHLGAGGAVSGGPKVNLGDSLANRNLNSLLSKIRQGKRVFLLGWEGNKVPRGAVILDQAIAWTQNGMVQSEDGKLIGTYDRVIEFGGESGNAQLLAIFAS